MNVNFDVWPDEQFGEHRRSALKKCTLCGLLVGPVFLLAAIAEGEIHSLGVAVLFLVGASACGALIGFLSGMLGTYLGAALARHEDRGHAPGRHGCQVELVRLRASASRSG